MYIYIYICIYVCVYIYLSLSLSLYIYIYIYIYYVYISKLIGQFVVGFHSCLMVAGPPGAVLPRRRAHGPGRRDWHGLAHPLARPVPADEAPTTV